MILYNFGIFLANEAAETNYKKKRSSKNKYLYEIDISSTLKLTRKFFLRRDSHKPVDIIKLMLKYVHAVRPQFRQFNRPLREIWAIHFGCRATLSGSHKQHFIIANFSRKKAQSHLNDTVMPLFLHSFSSVPGY